MSVKPKKMTDGDKIAKAIDRLTDTISACLTGKSISTDWSLVDALDTVTGAVTNLNRLGLKDIKKALVEAKLMSDKQPVGGDDGTL